MMGLRSHYRFQAREVKKRVRRGTFRSLRHAGGAIRLAARRSVEAKEGPAPVGHAPYTRKPRRLLKESILYALDKHNTTVAVGPSFRFVGRSASAHEFGKRYRGDDYPKRALMGPALRKVANRLPKMWRGSVR